jgi:hypothetical protein
MFPPLCFVDVSSGIVPDDSKDLLQDNMSDEEYEETYVYDIGVEDNHNFFASNVLVHNCHHLNTSP